MSSAVVAQFDVAVLSKPKPIQDEVLVGKDLLELLAGAMYADPMTIYREYVQNAADSIDLARQAGLDAGEFAVTIAIDRAERSIRIRDNGASIAEEDFVSRLTALGASRKRGTSLRGFRGVGRLAGLGYCQELIFRGRADANSRVSELRWDGRKLRELLRDSTFDGDLSTLVQRSVEFRAYSSNDAPARFFEVELRKVTRLRGDLLLNDETVRHFLAQVAPVPFAEESTVGQRIASFLAERGVSPPLALYIEGDASPILRRLGDEVTFSDKVRDPISGIEFLELRDQNGEVDAFGWMLEHSYLGAIPKSLGIGGIRLRCGNIQVGSESILAPHYAEARFAGWPIGELHVVSPRIVPNARRDDFEAGVPYAHLQDEIGLITRRLTQTIRDKSIARNRVRRVQEALGHAEQWLSEAKSRDIPSSIATKLKSIVADNLAVARKYLAKLDPKDESIARLSQRLKAVEQSERRILKEEVKLGRRSARDKAIDAAINTILEHASTPGLGLAMSRRVLEAFDEQT